MTQGKRTIRAVLLSQVAAVVAWVILGVFVVGYCGVLLTGQIPIFGLGMFLSLLGSLLHALFIGLNFYPSWWQVGGMFAFVLSGASVLYGSIGGDRYNYQFIVFFMTFYFVFGALLYVVIQRLVVKPVHGVRHTKST